MNPRGRREDTCLSPPCHPPRRRDVLPPGSTIVNVARRKSQHQNAENHPLRLHLHQDHGDTLLVWAGDKAHEAPDFLAVVDFDRDSRHYGEILRIVPLPARILGAGAVGNEPHHIGLSRDGRTLALGGLLSFLRGQDQVFFFDVTQPLKPKFISSNNPSTASITDEFAPLSTRGVSRDVHGRPGRRSSRACAGI